MSVLAFVAGLGGGYMQGKQRQFENDRELKRDAQLEQQFQWQAQDRARQEQEREAMRTAGRPIAITQGADLQLADGTTKSYDMPNGADIAGSDFRQMRSADQATGQQTLARGVPMPASQGSEPVDMPAAPVPALSVGGKRFNTAAEAQQEISAQNTPEAKLQRFVAALEGSGKPLEALQYQHAATTMNRDQAAYAKKLKDEGIAETARATLSGDAQSVFNTFNKQGDMKLDAVPTVTLVKKKIPGVGDIDSYDYSGNVTGPDGVSRPFKVNSHDLNMHLMPYKDALGLQLKGGDSEAKLLKILSEIQTSGEAAKLKGEAATAKAEAAAAKAANGDKPPVGYRVTKNGNLEAIPGGPADTKLQGALNADTAALTGSIASFDRLATAANEVLNHPGLPGITGLRGVIPNVPGSDAANAQALLATLKSQVGFGVLQDMRNNSKTGGALGSVSDAEGKRLEANLAALEKSQSLEQFQTNLKKIIDYSDKAKDRVREAYNLKHKDKAVTTAAAPENAVKANSPEDIQKLPSGSIFIGPDGIARRKP